MCDTLRIFLRVICHSFEVGQTKHWWEGVAWSHQRQDIATWKLDPAHPSFAHVEMCITVLTQLIKSFSLLGPSWTYAVSAIEGHPWSTLSHLSKRAQDTCSRCMRSRTSCETRCLPGPPWDHDLLLVKLGGFPDSPTKSKEITTSTWGSLMCQGLALLQPASLVLDFWSPQFRTVWEGAISLVVSVCFSYWRLTPQIPTVG